jgi:hypothetical protein
MFCARETVIGLDDLPRQARDQHMQQKFLKARPRLAAASASTWRDRGWGADLRRGGTVTTSRWLCAARSFKFRATTRGSQRRRNGWQGRNAAAWVGDGRRSSRGDPPWTRSSLCVSVSVLMFVPSLSW